MYDYYLTHIQPASDALTVLLEGDTAIVSLSSVRNQHPENCDCNLCWGLE